jgi:phosphotransferase system enzyme I (PtsI)
MVLFKRHAFAGFITDLGGATSHTAILARSLNLPSVMALHNARALIQEGDWLIVDGVAGVVIVDPDEAILDEYRLRRTNGCWNRRSCAASRAARRPPWTAPMWN